MPRISVITPAYNHEQYVEAAIASILAQTHTDFELIVTDDGSTDRTYEKLQQFSDKRMRLFRHDKNRGMMVALDNSWGQCSGELIAWFATDDIAEAHMLETLLGYLEAHPGCLGASGRRNQWV